MRTETKHWTEDALCINPLYVADDWFPHDGDKNTAERAKAICKTPCPVKNQCLAENLDVAYGIFGGLDQDERKALKRRGRRR